MIEWIVERSVGTLEFFLFRIVVLLCKYTELNTYVPTLKK